LWQKHQNNTKQKPNKPSREEISNTMINNPADELIIPGKTVFTVGSVFLLVAGIAELISGAIVISDSSGYYIGGVYVGIIAITTACRGLYLTSTSNFQIYLVLLVCSLIVAIVGTAIQANDYNFVSTLEACSSYSSSQSTSCSAVPASYTCTGNNDYYYAAELCEISYTYDNGGQTNQCSCVTNQDDATCYSYTNISDCSKLLNNLPSALQTSYAFDVICLLLSVFLLIFGIITYARPNWVNKNQTPASPVQASTFQPPPVVTATVVQGRPMTNNPMATAAASPTVGKANNLV
jgi:hypothetical protein